MRHRSGKEEIMAELITGIEGHGSEPVVYEVTAAGMKSGGLPVYATPRMINLMETTAWASVEPYMGEGMGTVGTYLDVKHIAASPVGATVKCDTVLTKIDGRRLVFEVKASDEAGVIGEGIHERFIIKNERFMEKAKAKLEK